MFTGLVRGLGRVQRCVDAAGGRLLVIGDTPPLPSLQVGDSVAVDGVCLTVVSTADQTLTFQAGPETLARTTLGRLQPGDRVNLEPALRLGDPLGGHWVTGHVDTIGTILQDYQHDEWRFMDIGFSRSFADYLVPKGSIAVDGVSLTVVSCTTEQFRVMLIPHTQSITTLGYKTVGAMVNLEFDLLAKYVVRLMQQYLHKFDQNNFEGSIKQ
ncbi:MAG: riboflavin synthase [Gemmataceae bacterium]|nr:riboflavin synthase [Gemmataceae bacterium]MCS7270742.1 riboflavin synthase [Gemmataceae bacterium]MDW8244428.1 riboflavin synthase [Thermogemmata sp.]